MFDNLTRRAESAQSEYERGYAQLFRDSEKKERFYSDAEHAQRELALRTERTRKLDALMEDLRGEVEAAQNELALLENGDPTAVLGAEELGVAASKRPFVYAP